VRVVERPHLSDRIQALFQWLLFVGRWQSVDISCTRVAQMMTFGALLGGGSRQASTLVATATRIKPTREETRRQVKYRGGGGGGVSGLNVASRHKKP
jgi:hypothetical protein